MKELEDILRRLLFVDPEKPIESGAIWPLYPEDDNFPKIVEAIQELITKARREELEALRWEMGIAVAGAVREGDNLEAHIHNHWALTISTRLAELDKQGHEDGHNIKVRASDDPWCYEPGHAKHYKPRGGQDE